MSQYNDYYANKGEGGGGYVQTQSPYSSPGGAPRKQGAQHALRPVTIKQLLSATQVHADAEFKIDDIEVGQTTLVAQVIEIKSQATNCTYILEDGYGRFEARHWNDTSGEEEDNVIKTNTFIRVMGSLKSFNNKTYINATHIRPCTDPHERYFHMLEAMTVTLMLQRGPPGQQNGQTHVQGEANGTSPYTAQAQTSASAGDAWSFLPPLQRKIIHFILDQPNRKEGIHVTTIARAVGGDAHEISGALDTLMDEGHVYTTLDETHFDVAI